MPVYLIVLLSFLGALLVLLLLLGALGAIYVAFPKKVTYEQALLWEKEKNYLLDCPYDKLPSYSIKARDGYLLHAELYEAEKATDRYVLSFHGYSYCLLGNIKYANLFHRLGYHVILVDMRGHGKNKRCKCTLGKIEARDVIDVIADTKARYPNCHIGLQGESMGAASVLNALQYGPDIDWVVEDCGYASLQHVIEHKVKTTLHAPRFFATLSSFMSKILFGFSYGEVKPIEGLKGVNVPILFFHGEADTFVPKQEVDLLFSAYEGPKEKVIVPKAEHALSYWQDPESYYEHLSAFLAKYGSPKNATKERRGCTLDTQRQKDDYH